VAIGAFVTVKTNETSALGIGKVVDLMDHHATVAYFDVPGERSALEVTVPVNLLRVVSLPTQTRVFRLHEDTGRWQVGRVLDGEGPTCFVAFPNKVTVNVPREQLQVRWRKPIENPNDFLFRQVTETPLFTDLRSKYVREITNQRNASCGIGALLSSSIQLTDYQFNVVRKVLQDPVQRYLLADEVGLGKTIEAGVLIRQYTIDDVDARILLIVPPLLVTQWRAELAQRFGLGCWLDDQLWIVPHDDVDEVAEHMQTAGMVVVDEAHHLSRRDTEASSRLYELLKRHAASVPRLLLLSGTPVLADTAGFLRILHLLDPVVFPLDDLIGFERRLQSRQLIAEIAASLQPENVLAMEDDLDRLRDRFGDDLALMNRVEALRPIVQSLPDEDDDAFLNALQDLRAHLSETYKLHRRVLRNRRKAVPWATPRRKGLKRLSYSCHWQIERKRVIETLRVYLNNLTEVAGLTSALFSSAVHFGGGPSLEKSLRDSGINDESALELARRADDLKNSVEEAGERDKATYAAIRDWLTKPGVQVVVFCDQIATADRVAGYLQSMLGRTTEVLRHQGDAVEIGEDGGTETEMWRRFLTLPAACRVLVCDYRAEEGLNLHGGHKVAFHYDLPIAPNRIEQRLGRLDRFGVSGDIWSLAPVCDGDFAEAAWVDCLADGLQVFSVSMASLQYLVENSLKIAVQDWFDEGVDGLRRWKDGLAGPTGWAAIERRRIDQQDSLDAMGDPASKEFERLEEVDSDWQRWRSAFDGFAFKALLFHNRPEPWDGALPKDDRVFRMNFVRDKDQQTLISLTDFVGQFLGAIDTEARHSTAKSPLSYPYAYSRRTVLSKEGRTKGLRSLRYGDSLVESLTAFCRFDDRGRAFAMWRYRPSLVARDASGSDLWFRFDFLIEAGVPETHDDFSRAIKRRAEQHFTPRFYTVWVSAADGATLQPPDVVSAEYRDSDSADGGGRDFNLNFRRWDRLYARLDLVPWLMEWRRHCEAALARAQAFILEYKTLEEQCTQSLMSLKQQHALRVAQIESRISRLAGAAQSAERRHLEDEEQLFVRTSEAIRAPAIHTDIAGAVLVSPINPFSQ
jgi:ATP-dependent helicase HepA